LLHKKNLRGCIIDTEMTCHSRNRIYKTSLWRYQRGNRSL